MIIEGEIEWRAEDGCQALIVDVVPSEAPEGIGASLVSWVSEHPGIGVSRYDLGDLARIHPDLAKLIAGKSRMRVTIEVMD
jgi:hypothetical protein